MSDPFYEFEIEEIKADGKIHYWFKTLNHGLYYAYFTAATDFVQDFENYTHLSQFGYVMGFSPAFEDDIGAIKDPMIGATIVQIAIDFLSKRNKVILMYHCDMYDGKQRHRRIRFGQWHREFGCQYNVVKYSIELDVVCNDGTVHREYLGYYAVYPDQDLLAVTEEFNSFANEKVYGGKVRV